MLMTAAFKRNQDKQVDKFSKLLKINLKYEYKQSIYGAEEI